MGARSIRPLGNKLAVVRITSPEEEISLSMPTGDVAARAVVRNGVAIPSEFAFADDIRRKDYFARVVAVGPGKMAVNGHRTQMPASPGDVVALGFWAGKHSYVRIDSEEFDVPEGTFLVDSAEVLAVVPQEG
jgi:co-chaperonin GroES (HSP10)